jgi:2-keto-4-pentenoate hydratase/2-oxohepta-3-ene-1,7-dioic acid hydratase in catechol pathway
MKLATYSRGSQEPRIGVVIEGGIVDLADVAPELPREMTALIKGGSDVLKRVEQATARGVPSPLHSVKLMPPILRPPEFLGIGLNYRNHIEEAGLPIPSVPTVFNKQISCIVGPKDDVVLPRVSAQLDYEGELGLVVGSAARRLSRDAAAAAIFGYVVVNDLSVRDWQFRSPTVTLGKSFDTHGPIGPWIVTADEVPNVESLSIITTVNGDIRQRGRIADMIFGCSEVVAFLSEVMTLQPGTVITTGTPAGVGLFRRPPEYLRAGDLVIVDIPGVGRLENRVVADTDIIGG